MQGLNNRLTRSSSYEFWHDSNDMAPPLMVLVTPPPPPLTTKGTAACMTTPEKRPIFSDEERCQEEHNPEVVRCTSFTPSSDSNGSSFRRRSPLITVPPKNNKNSRLLSSPKTLKSEKKRRARRAITAASSSEDDEEDDDPFLEEDLPEEFKRWQISWFVVVEWVSLVLIVAALICNLTVPNMKVKKLWDLKLWKWEVMVLVLICGRLVSSWGIRILVVFFIERNFLLRKRVLYFVYGLKRGVVNSLWLGLVLLAWRLLFHKKLRQETNSKALEHVTGVLVCLLVGTIIWLVKTLIVKVLASSFHVSTYFDRIQDALFDQFIIKNLTGLPLIQEDDDGGGHLSQEKDCRKDFQSPDNLISENVILVEIEELQKIAETVAPPVGLITPTATSPDLNKSNISNSRMTRSGRIERSPRATVVADTITIDHLHRLTPRNVSAWNMKRLMHLVRHEKLVTLDEQLSNQSDESEIQINSASEAREAARKIFKNVAKRCSKYIYMEDLMRFMAEDEAVKTMSRFEGAADLKFSKKALKNWVVNVYRERRALALTLNDTKTAVNRLHHIVNAIVGLIIFIIWLLILGILSSKLLVLICSQLVLVAFVFGNSCKDVFESIIFLFVMHPFDVGDRCEIDHVEMIVEEMNILTTVFLRYDNLKITIPNGVLASKAISNYRRSPDMEERIEFSIHIATPTEKIAVMKQRITSYIEKKSEHWVPGPMIFFKNVEDLDKMKMAVWLCHRMNHHYMGEKWARRGLLVEEMIKIFKDLDINYKLLPVDIVKLQP